MDNFDTVREIQRILNHEARSILAASERLDNADERIRVEQALNLFLTALNAGGKIVVTGLGKSGKVAQKIAATLSSTGSLAVYLHPTEGLHGDLGIVSKQDVVFALSYSGNTDELIQLLPSLKTQDIPIVGMGGNPDSKLARICSVWINASVDHESCPLNLAPTASTTLTLALGDAIALALMQLRGFDINSFARLHPGGSLGRRLNLRVRDLMKSKDECGIIDTSANMDQVIALATRRPLGGVLIAKDGKLKGLITDGDLRRAIQERKDVFFELRAEDIMSPKPVTTTEDAMAKEALELMENRKSQISVLPVVDSDMNCKGLIRLHDLVQTL